MTSLIERISIHYKNNVGNRYLRPAFMSMTLDGRTWELIDSITEKYQYFSAQGLHLDELYERILALARFVYSARKETGPNLRSLLGGHGSSAGKAAEDRVLRDMAVNNFSSNLGVLADLINELYVMTVDIDTKMNRDSIPVYKQTPELQNLGRYLLG